MTDLLLNIQGTLLTIGLPSIDESLDKLLVAMETFPKSAVLGDTVAYARILGLCLALCVGSYECWMMMLGRRGMDVIKLLRIIGLSMCISSSGWICSQLQVPGKALENTTKQMAQSKNKEVAALELKVAQKQADYLNKLRAVQDSIETGKQVQAIGEDAHWWDKLIYNMENLSSTINNYAQRAAVAAETKASEWINDIIRFIGELIFQMSYYGILVAQRIFITIMAVFAPIMVALSTFHHGKVHGRNGCLNFYHSRYGVLLHICACITSILFFCIICRRISGIQPSAERERKFMEPNRSIGVTGNWLELHVCNGNAHRCLYYPLCSRSGILADTWRCQFSARKCSRRCCGRCRNGSGF
jgi:hypothetical protein